MIFCTTLHSSERRDNNTKNPQFWNDNSLAKLFDLQLAGHLRELGDHLDMQTCARALNRRGFLTFTGTRWNAKNLRAARRHALAPRPSIHHYVPGFGITG
jgi:hypothetical protein